MPDLFSSQIPDSRTWYLISRDTKGKIRYAIISYELENGVFVIHRETGQYGGKRTSQPDKYIEHGKAARSRHQQVELEALHLVKEKKDKGYREVEKDPDTYSEAELNSILGEVITGQQGVPKPMLAKQLDKVTNLKILNKEWYASRKIDGLRCLIYIDKGELHTASRGAMNYDSAMVEILTHPTLIKLFKDNPGLILDGEAYHYGWTLQALNSVARTQKTAKDLDILQFYWYDIVDTNSTFEERWAFMQDIRDQLNLTFDPERNFERDELRIQFVPQEIISGYDNMMNLHNKFVSEGWEGVVIRDPNRPYKPNGRTNDMIKIKKYRDDTFKVIDYELGLRGSEDMVFVCEMEDGRTFKAKPFGDRAQKEEYVENFDKLYKNHIGECKFFYYSDDGKPLQPSFKCFRDDLV